MLNDALSRAHAFRSRGVTLKFPEQSLSGVRDEDGMVVFALAAPYVRMDAWGFSCLLWTRAEARKQSASDIIAGSDLERLGHCRLALRHGIAEGFVVYGDATSKCRDDVIALRVVKAGEEYWAKWGWAARADCPRRHTVASMAGIQ
jgi:hypothetical protein